MRYVGIGPREGIVVPEEDAFEYALAAMRLETEKDKREFTEWFFSKNYIKEEE